MIEASREQRNAVEAVLACVALYPQGVARAVIEASMSANLQEVCDSAIASATSQGWIETSPMFGDRLRWARPNGPFKQAAAWVRLRDRAKPLLARIHHHSGLPVTLHVLFGRAHAVIERFPEDSPAAIVEEVSRYSTPRSLTNGMTSKVFLACLPPERDEAALVEPQERDAILRCGFGYAPSARAGWGGVLSAPVRATDGASLAALCTFGASQRLTPERVDAIGPIMRHAADQLAAESEADVRLLQEAAETQIARPVSFPLK